MITIAIVIGAGLCYWFEWYALAFWILIYAIVYGGLSAVRATVRRNLRIECAATTGAESSYMASFLTKEVPIVFLIPVAWHVGVIAGYL